MKFKPLHDRVLIEVLDSSEKTAGGIIIPDTAQEKAQEVKVVAVGGGAKTDDGNILPMVVKVGDKVLFGLGALVSKIYFLFNFSNSSKTLTEFSYRFIPLWSTPQISIKNTS